MTNFRIGMFAAVLLIATVPLSAHHSFAAEYDADKPIQVTGTVTKVEWTNPQLNRLGWKRDAVKAGDQVTVQGYLAKDGAKMANARNVVFADGRKIFAGSSGDGGPPQ